jgi:DNA polymerase I-like protein with 3'-5' exonuclease and polymerase domains/uracil-DNA glycosylase
MRKSIGLFTREDLSEGLNKKAKPEEMSDEALRQLGIKGVEGMNPRAKHPNLQPSGSKHPLLYVMGTNPTPADDEDGEPFSGIAGRYLRSRIDHELRPKVRYGHVVRTLPTKEPNRSQIECFRQEVIEDVEKTKPAAILGCGKMVLDWMVGPKLMSVWDARGRRFPIRVGTHECWFYPVEHPVAIYEAKDDGRGEGDSKDDRISGEQKADCWKRDIATCCDEVLEGLPAPKVLQIEQLEKNITIITGLPGDLRRVSEFLASLKDELEITFDTESSHLRPYSEGAKLISIALGTHRRAMAIGIDHPETKWSDDDRAALEAVLKAYFCTPQPKVAQNLKHDLEWLYHRWGDEVLRPCRWNDTMMGAYALDERTGTHGLNFQSALWLGIPIKKSAGVDRKNLIKEPLDKVLRYNGLDVKVTHYIRRRQRKAIKKEGLNGIYRQMVRRIPTLVIAQVKGFPISQEERAKHQRIYRKRIAKTIEHIKTLPEVLKFEKRYGKFDPTNPTAQITMFQKFLKHKEGMRGNNRYSTDKRVLKAIGGPLALSILKLREYSKQLSTYIDPLDPEDEESIVYPDGKVHTSLNTTITSTERLSSEDPNMQNYPVRNPETKKVRACFVPPEEHVILSVDYSAIQARAIAMASKDPELVKSFWDNIDIHMHWAEKIVRKYDRTFKARGSDMDAFRGEVKNQMVFPAFFGSSGHSISKSLEMPFPIFEPLFKEFWKQFAGVKRWQNRTNDFYQEHFYVESLGGFRRHGPMTWNMLINSGIQGTEVEIVLDAMDRLSERAIREDKPWLSAFLQIHDSLEFFVPRKKVDAAVSIITEEMCTVPFNYVNVPIQVEAKIGPNWCDLEKIGKFSSVNMKLARKKVA